MRGRRECGPRWWRGRGRPARRCTYRRRHAPRRARDDRRTRIEGTRGCRRAPAAPRVPSSGRPPPGPKKKQAGKPKAGAQFDGSRPPHGPRSHPSTSFVPFRTLPMARCSSCLSNADVPFDDIGADAFARSLNRPELKSKRERATFRAAFLAAQISRSPTGPSRAFLSRCERFREPSSCAPVCEGMRDVRGGARANT